MVGLSERLGFTRSAHFRAVVTVYDLIQVPLATGQFRVKWKYKDATHLAGDEANAAATGSEDGSKRSKGLLHPSHASHRTERSVTPTTRHRSQSPASAVTDSSDADGALTRTNTRPSTDQSRDALSLSHTLSHASDRGAALSAQTTLNSVTSRTDGAFSPLSASTSNAGQLQQTSPGAQANAPPKMEPKGTTGLVQLEKHSVRFNREIYCHVAIPIKSAHTHGHSSSSTSRPVLQPSPLKLSIRREAKGKGGKIEEVKMGDVTLDLSQFTSSKHDPSRPRRYLLQGSKTNATLRVGVRMDWVGGESDWQCPPPRSGQIYSSSNSSSVLSHSSWNKSGSSLSSKRGNGSSSRPSSMHGSSEMFRVGSSSSIGSKQSSSNASNRHDDSRPGWKPPPHLSTFSQQSDDHYLAGQAAVDVIDRIFAKSDFMLSPSQSVMPSPTIADTPRMDRDITPHARKMFTRSAISSRVPSDATATVHQQLHRFTISSLDSHTFSSSSANGNHAKSDGLRILTHGRPTHAASLPPDSAASARSASIMVSSPDSVSPLTSRQSSGDSRVHFSEQRASVASAPAHLGAAASRKCPFGEKCSEHFHLHAPDFHGAAGTSDDGASPAQPREEAVH